jgi:uncharacterized OsmC-like protein
MSVIKIQLGQNLCTQGGLANQPIAVKTAFNAPREELNPGELLCASLGSCMLTMVGFMASKRGEDAVGTEVSILPEFDEKHTRIEALELTFSFPSHFTAAQKEFYSRVAQTCPVHNSLRTDIAYTVHF